MTVEGEYKPGRVRFTVTDMTIPLVGLPITIGRTYDSLERDEVGDFGYGWSLAIANPKLEIDEAQNVTITMPDGRRSTFYFTPQVPSALFGFLMTPHYTPEPGVYGSLESNGCGVLTISSGIYACFPGPIYSQSVTGFIYTDPYGRKFEIAATGELRSITDLNDNVLTFTPDGITSTTGMVVPFVRDEEGRIVQITDPEDNVFLYDYDALGNLDTVTLPDTDDPIQYDYYSGHFFKSATDPRGNQAVLTTYDEDNRLASVIDAEGNVTNYSYDPENRITYVGYMDGGIATFIYDEHGYLQTYTNPLNKSTIYTYDNNHNLLTVTNPESEMITYVYNEDGHRTHVYDPDGNLLIEAVYNEYGGPISLTTYIDGTPTTRTITYDEYTFMPLSASDTIGDLGSYTWDSNGSPLTFTNAENEVTTYTYYDYGYVHTETNPLGEVTEYTYDTFGRMLTQEDPLERITTYTYDALGRVETITDVEGGVIEYQYDANGNVEVMIDQVGNQTNYEYDANNRLIKIINPVDNSFSEFEYDFRGNLTKETDPDGFDTCYLYDTAGQLTSTQPDCDPTLATTYTYDHAGRVTDVTDPTGVVTHYVYDNMGRVTDVTTAYGTGLAGTTHYEYDTIGQLISMTDPNNNITTYEYDIRGRRVKTIFPDGGSPGEIYTEQEYDGVGRLLVYIDELGIKTSYTYDDLGRLTDTAVISADDSTTVSTTHTEYDEVGRRTETIDANGLHTCYEYDDDNADTERTVTVTAVCDQPGSEVVIAQYVYDLAGQLLSYADANGYTAGYVTSYTYNEHGQLIQTDYPDSTYTTQEYRPSGRLHWSYDQDGVQTIYSYDTVGRLDLVQVIDSDGLTELSHTEYDYDDAGRRERVTQKLNALEDTETFYTYDLAGRLETVTEAYGVLDLTTTYTYNTAGQLVSVEDVREKITTYEYNERGWRDKTIFPGGAYPGEIYTEQEYNDAGQIVAYRDENGYETTYTYDNVGRLQTVTNPESEEVEYGYNTAGQVTAIIDAEFHQTAFTYDIFGRLETKTWADGVTVETFGYDNVGNLTSHQWADGVDTNINTFVYDNMNRLWQAHYFDSLDVVLTYTDSGQVETVALDGATPTTYTYNGLGLPTSVTHPNGDLIEYDYDLAGRRTEMTLPDTTTIAYTYDEANRLRTITNSTLPGAIELDYDGYLLNEIDYPSPNDLNEYYIYNDRGQLTRVFQATPPQNPVADYDYALDLAGNRTRVDLQGDAYIEWDYDHAYRLTVEEMWADSSTQIRRAEYDYDDAGNRVEEIVGGVTTTYTYNDNDQLTQTDDGSTITTYDYDLHGNLEQITQGTDITLFDYNGLERLESVTLPDTTTIDYTYDADGRRLSQTVNSTDTTTYLWDEFSRYGDVVQTSTATEDVTYTTGMGLVLVQSSGSDDHYFYHDGQGSTRALADASGNVVDSYTYTAFGELYGYTGTPQTDFLYTGQQYDDLTDLYNLRARMYDPGIGRFLGQDIYPIDYQNPVELNRYVYTANNPINLVDPSGLLVGVASINREDVEASPAVATFGKMAFLYYVPIVATVGLLVGADVLVGDLLEEVLAPPKAPSYSEEDLEEFRRRIREAVEEATRRFPRPVPVPKPEPKPGPEDPPIPVCVPTTDEDCFENRGYDIALGLTTHKTYEKIGKGNARYEIRTPILMLFAMNLNLDPSRKNYVFPWQDWETLGWVDESIPAVDQFKVAANFADHIHFNLEYIKDPIKFAYEKGNKGSSDGWIDGFHSVTAAELYIITTNKSEYCDRITFYDNGSTNPTENHSAWTQICGDSDG